MAQGTGNGKGGTDEGKEKSRWRTSCIANEMSFEEADEPLAITIITAEGVFFFSSFFSSFFSFFLFPLFSSAIPLQSRRSHPCPSLCKL